MSNLSGSLRIRILERDGYKCVYCGALAVEGPLEVDHVMPRSAGGSNDSTNLVTACRRCNNGKRARLLKLPEGLTPEPVASGKSAGRRRSNRSDSSRPFVMARATTSSGRDTGYFRLSIYAEIDYSAVLGLADPYPADPFDWYCGRLRDAYPEAWASDAVPIVWSVEADGPGLHTAECAPWHSCDPVMRCGWDRYFSHPVDERGRSIDWKSVPVHMRRFDGFEDSIGWLPTIEDRTAPVRSLWIANQSKSVKPSDLRLPCPECGLEREFKKPQVRCEQCDIWLIGRHVPAGIIVHNPARTWIMQHGKWTPAVELMRR